MNIVKHETEFDLAHYEYVHKVWYVQEDGTKGVWEYRFPSRACAPCDAHSFGMTAWARRCSELKREPKQLEEVDW